jgi:hypothetical protein
MPTYRFRALTREGGEVRGERLAASAEALRTELMARGWLLGRARPVRRAGRWLARRGVSWEALLLFNQELTALLRAGLSVPEALATTAGRGDAGRLGLTPQKPLKRAFEQNPQAVRKWLDEEYPAIREQAKAEDAEIHWGDEMGLRADHQAGRSWGKRGVTPVIPATGQRFGCNMISTITNRGRLSFTVFQGKFNAPLCIDFLRRLVKSSPRKVFLIADRHPVHRSRAVARWLEQHQHRIRLFFLPGYSPELNPDELPGQDVKTNALGRRRPRSLSEMMYQVRSFLWSTQRNPDKVRRYFHAPQARYAVD